MAFEARRSAGARPKKPAPPYFSHEFIITNHGDIISCVLMVLLAGLFFQPTYSYSHTLIFPQYNETTQLPGDSSKITICFLFLELYLLTITVNFKVLKLTIVLVFVTLPPSSSTLFSGSLFTVSSKSMW